MTLYTFRLLSPQGQLRCVLEQGTYLAQRWADKSGVNLYYLPDAGRGFLAEVGVDEERFVVLRSFSNSVPLEDYAQEVRLPDGWAC